MDGVRAERLVRFLIYKIHLKFIFEKKQLYILHFGIAQIQVTKWFKVCFILDGMFHLV